MWWESLSYYQQVLFLVAIFTTVLMLIFLILSLIGIGDSDFDMDVDLETDAGLDGFNDEPLSGIGSMKLFTLRTALVFISVGSWSTLVFIPATGDIWATIIGALIGIVAAFLVALALHQAMKLQSSGNIDYANAIGKTGTVYVSIPKNKTGFGKVTLIVQERFVECDAVTLDNEDLKTDTLVEVIGLEDQSILVVKRK